MPPRPKTKARSSRTNGAKRQSRTPSPEPRLAPLGEEIQRFDREER
jgi:hypothetical protein